MHMDHESLIAAMLHDVIEDTSVPKDIITNEFGPDVAHIVDGLSKLTQIEFESHVDAQAKNFHFFKQKTAYDILLKDAGFHKDKLPKVLKEIL